MYVGRARFLEHFQRVIREDMLTLFNHTADLRALELSVVLHGTQSMTEETKYRAACALEILTGQRAFARRCNVEWEDPMHRTLSEAQRLEIERARGALIQRSLLGTRRKGSSKQEAAGAAAIPADLRKAGNGLKIQVDLHKVKMFYFLEKLREFYLPDIVGGTAEGAINEQKLASWRPPMQGHSNAYSRKGIQLHFEKKGGSKRDCYPPRYLIKTDQNPTEAISTYILRSSDLLKFPDLELHFEPLAPILGGMGSLANNNNIVHLILRPTVTVSSPLTKEALQTVPPVDNLRIMNYLLSQFFNSYMSRPHVGIPLAAN